MRRGLVALGLCAALAGCGSAGASSAHQPTTVLIADCSGSTIPFRGAWESQVENAAAEAVLRHDMLWIDCIDGEPLSTTTFAINIDGSRVPEALRSNPTIARRYLLRVASSLQPRIAQLLGSTQRQHGSGLLDALEVVAGLRPTTLIFWTDGLLIQDGVNLNDPQPPGALDQLAREWGARLGGLRGTEVTIVGLGRDAHDAASARRARRLLPAVLRAAGASVETLPELPHGSTLG